MSNIRLPRGLCAVVGEALRGSHSTLDALFVASGAPGDPPDLAHHSKWKEWLFRAGQDTEVDSLRVLGNILEEFMDVEPSDGELLDDWKIDRQRVEKALSSAGFEYFQGGRVLPNGILPAENHVAATSQNTVPQPQVPTSVSALLQTLVTGLPRAMHPLSHRRKGASSLTFQSEYDIQDLLHALMMPWVADIRAEEYVPSYAGRNTRMDFLLPAHEIVIETKRVRSTSHAKSVGEELTIDIAHYSAHEKCSELWCVVYDPEKYIKNVAGLVDDLSGTHRKRDKSLKVKVVVV